MIDLVEGSCKSQVSFEASFEWGLGRILGFGLSFGPISWKFSGFLGNLAIFSVFSKF